MVKSHPLLRHPEMAGGEGLEPKQVFASPMVPAATQYRRSPRAAVASRRRTPSGARRKPVGVVSVTDKDTASELLAREPHVDPFVILTDADAGYTDKPSPEFQSE